MNRRFLLAAFVLISIGAFSRMGAVRQVSIESLVNASTGKYEITGDVHATSGNSFQLSAGGVSITVMGDTEQCTNTARGSGRCTAIIQKSGSTYTLISGRAIEGGGTRYGQLEEVRVNGDRLYGKIEGRWVPFNDRGIF